MNGTGRITCPLQCDSRHLLQDTSNVVVANDVRILILKKALIMLVCDCNAVYLF